MGNRYYTVGRPHFWGFGVIPSRGAPPAPDRNRSAPHVAAYNPTAVSDQDASPTGGPSALLTKDEWLRLASQGTELGLWYWNEITQTAFWDRKTRDIFGVEPHGDVTLEFFYAAVHPDDLGRVREIWRRQLENRAPYEIEYRIVRRDGSLRWINARGSGYYDATGTPLFMIGVIFDITDRKAAEQERQELVGRLIRAQEDERRHLAREIHDDFCQRFAVMSVKLGALAGLVDGAEASALTRELIGAFGDLGNDIQSLSHRLHSSKLDILGLVPSIESLCADIAKEYGIPVDFQHASVPPHISPDVGLCLFRIVQEGLRNAVRHSGASRIVVRLEAGAAGLSLTVIDNGKGIAFTSQSPSRGIGIQSMRERTRMVGGSFDIHSAPPTPGTRIAVTVPLSNGD